MILLRNSKVLLALVLLMLAGHTASAQTARTIKVIVPSTPGGGADVLARLLADQDQPDARCDLGGRESPRREQHDRDRSRRARRARRQYAADHHARIRHQCPPAQAE